MWFIDEIIERLDAVTDFFLDAYYEVKDWVFPFYYLASPLYGMYVSFYYITYYFGNFNSWLAIVDNRIDDILNESNILNLLDWWLDTVVDNWNWIRNSWFNVSVIVNDWWLNNRYIVLGWIDDAIDITESLFASLSFRLSDLQSDWDNFAGKIPSLDEVLSWFPNRWIEFSNIFNQFFNERLTDIQNLIDTAFVTRQNFWNGWQEVYINMGSFFEDPLQWVNNKIDEFFERFW